MILIVPSRGRPKRAAKMLHSARTLAHQPVQIVIAVDPDDPELEGYRTTIGTDLLVLDERLGYSGTLNLVAAAVWNEQDILGAFGDDVIFRTPWWDDRIRDALATPGIAFGNDLAHGANHPTAVFMSSAIARALGWLALPVCRHQYVDDGWKALGQALGILRYREEVVVEHVHPAYGKGAWDQTYREVYEFDQAHADDLAFQAWRDGPMTADLEKVRPIL